jgi:hypothetical protein
MAHVAKPNPPSEGVPHRRRPESTSSEPANVITTPRSAGISAGFAGGLALDRLAGSYFEKLQMPGAWVVAGTAGLLIAAAVVASAWPAMRAARVDVIQALRAD